MSSSPLLLKHLLPLLLGLSAVLPVRADVLDAMNWSRLRGCRSGAARVALRIEPRLQNAARRLAAGVGLHQALAAQGYLASQSAALHAATYTLDNDRVTVTCETRGDALLPGSLRDKLTGQVVKLGSNVFSLVLSNGDVLSASEFKLAGRPRIETLPVNPAMLSFPP